MKMITFLTLILALIALITPNNHLRKTLNKVVPGATGGTCPFIKTKISLDTSFPPDVQKGALSITKAETQSKAARHLLYSPNTAAKSMLVAAAQKLKDVVSFNAGNGDAQKQMLFTFFFSDTWNRQLSAKGTWSHVSEQPQTAFDRIIAGNGKSQDYLGLLALLGDVGAQLADSHNPAKVQELTVEISTGEADLTKLTAERQAIFSRMDKMPGSADKQKVHDTEWLPKDTAVREATKKLDAKKRLQAIWQVIKLKVVKVLYPQPTGISAAGETAITAAIQNMRSYVSGDALVPNKPKERGMCLATETSAAPILTPRSAVFNRYEAIQNSMAADAKLTPTAWPWQTVPTAFIQSCNDEPWAGHVSGSVGELMFVLHLFTEPTTSYGAYPYTAENNENRKLRAALAATFLLATGMHTALEVAYPVKMFVGDALKLDTTTNANAVKDAICASGQDPTTYVTNLINSFVDKTKKLEA
jgi:hypothetical protein